MSLKYSYLSVFLGSVAVSMEELEEITNKPSIEAIPDEYEHFTDVSSKPIHVHFFSTSDKEAQNKVKMFQKVLEKDTFKFMEHSLERDNCPNILIESKCFFSQIETIY